MSILDLPDEVLLTVFYFLTGEDLSITSAVSHKWFILSETDNLWKWNYEQNFWCKNSPFIASWKGRFVHHHLFNRNLALLYQTGKFKDFIEKDRGHRGAVLCLDFIGENHLITTGSDSILQFWDLERFSKKTAIKTGDPMRIHLTPICSTCASPNTDNPILLTGDADGCLATWPNIKLLNNSIFQADQEKFSLAIPRNKVHKGFISSLQFMENNDKFLSAGSDGLVQMWDTYRLGNIPVGKVDLHRSRILSMKYESNLAVSSHGDSCIIFTDIRSGQVSLEIKTKANGSAFDMNLSQYLLVTGDFDSQVIIRDLRKTEAIVRQMSCDDNRNATIMSLGIDCRRIITGDSSGYLKIWNLNQEGDQELQPKSHEQPLASLECGSPVRCLDFNEKYLVFGLYNAELNVLSYPFAKPDRFPQLVETCAIS